MATRIVERELPWCRSKLAAPLAEHGFRLDSWRTEDSVVQEDYAAAEAPALFYRPHIRVELVSVSPQTTRVSVQFPVRWTQVCLSALASCGVGLIFLLPFLTLDVYVAPKAMARLGWWRYVIKILSSLWFLCYILPVAVRVSAAENRQNKAEKVLWEKLDPDGSTSHEIAMSLQSFVELWPLFGLLLAIIVALFCCQAVVMVLLGGTTGLLGLCAVFLPCMALGLAFCNCIRCAARLPHRYHWKADLAGMYLLWWCFACAAGVCLVVIPFVEPVLSRLRVSESIFVILYVVYVAALAVHTVLLFKTVLGRKAWEHLGNHEASARVTARYEELCEKPAVPETARIIQRYRFWTRTLFVIVSLGWYITAGYVGSCLIIAGVGCLGAGWAQGLSWCLPTVMPAQGCSRAIQALLPLSLASAPYCLTVVLSLRSLRAMCRRRQMGQQIAKDMPDLGLPKRPLAYLLGELGSGALQMAVAPVPGIGVQLEQAGVLGQKYLLWVSVGAQKGLLTDEMEALLWHECGHVALLKRLWWRELAALLTPWAPRFLDLAEDPYEDERRADSLAVQRMGSPEPLLSVLRKLKEQQRLRDGTGYRRARPGGWRLLCWADEVWEERWVGYLHPDVEQRLRWLQAMRGEGDA